MMPTTSCRTCGCEHPVSPFGECPRWAPPLLDALTADELETLIGRLSGAALEVEAEMSALHRMDRRARHTWPGGFARHLYGTDAGAYAALAIDMAWLFGEALSTQKARA